MGRPKKSVPAPIEPEEESQDIEVEEPEFSTDDDIEAEIEQAKSPEKAVNKSQAARAAIDAGYEKAAEAVAWVKKTYGIDIGVGHFAAIKSNYKKKQGGAAAKEPEAPAPKRAAATPTAPAPKADAMTGPGLLGDLAAVKHLVEKLGADEVKQIVDLFK